MRKNVLKPILISALLLIALGQNAFASTKSDAEDGSMIMEERKGILIFESKNKAYRFWTNITMQFDGEVSFDSKAYNKIGNGVNLRRGQFALKSILAKDWYGELSIDFAGGKVNLREMYFAYKGVKNLSLSLGHFKEAFGMDMVTSSTQTLQPERTMLAGAFMPGYRLGFQAHYVKNWFLATGGLHFQSIDTESSNNKTQTFNDVVGDGEGLSATFRTVFMPFHADKDRSLHIGGGFSYRTPKSNEGLTSLSTPSARIRTRSWSSINRKTFLATPYIDDLEYMVYAGAEIAGHSKAFRIQSEYIHATYKRYLHRSEMYQGGYLQMGVMLFGGHQRYDSSNGRFGAPTRGRKWGDIELTLRAEYLDLDDNDYDFVSDLYGGHALAIGGGLTYHATDNFRFMLVYNYFDHSEDANGVGNYNIGYDSAGLPTNNISQVDRSLGEPGIRYGTLQVRFQMLF